ncbi:hypothetical protein AVEN_223127-1 [Araneus ventricosus]|uniref:Uncharacterized protein n=1 Tax=Araneus ventricosus TaxID=182803 RepID=A0A4Y2ECH3_ARAVE|nr:hypothetical protein AVEN_223127-1 [Araneus ventricosus]
MIFSLPAIRKCSTGQPGNSCAQAAAAVKKEEKTDEKEIEAKTDKVTDLKDSLEALKDMTMLVQEFPALLEAARRCRSAETKQERIFIVLDALLGE